MPDRRGSFERAAERIARSRLAWHGVRRSAARQLGTLGLALESRLPVLVGLTIAGSTLATDALLLPMLGVACNSTPSAQLVPVFTAVAGLSGLVALAVTVSSGPLESALGRFPVGVGAPLLEDEPRDGLLALLVVTFTAALALLVAAVLGLSAPVSGAIAVAGFGIGTLASLIGYVKQRMVLRYPPRLAEHLAGQMGRWLGEAVRRPREDPGREVAAGLQTRYSANLDRLKAICRSLLEEDKRDQQDEAAEVLVELVSTALDYSRRRRRLDPNSTWFPSRLVPDEGHVPTLTPLYERFALGRVQRSEQEFFWFEEAFGRAFEELISVAAERQASSFCLVWTESLKLMVREAFVQQEFGLLDVLIRVTRQASAHLSELPELARLVNVPASLVQLADRVGLQVGRIEPAVMSGRSLDAKNVMRGGLPTELAELLLDMGERLKNERRIEKASPHYTPLSAVTLEAENRAETRQKEVRERYLRAAAVLSSGLADDATAAGRGEALASLIGTNFLMAERLLMGEDVDNAGAFLRAGLGRLDDALDSSELPENAKHALVDRLRALVLRSIYDRFPGILQEAGPALTSALAKHAASNGLAKHDLLAILTIGNVAAELRREARTRDVLLSGLDAVGIGRDQYARETLDAAGDAPLGLIPLGQMVRYGEWAQPLLNEIRALEKRAVSGPGERGFDLEPDHESALVRRIGGHHDFGNLDVAARLFLTSLTRSPADPGDTTTANGPEEG